MPTTTIYIGPYVDGRQNECPPLAGSRKTFCLSPVWDVLGQTVASLHPIVVRRESTPLFVLEMVVLGVLGLITTLLLAGADATIWGGLVLAEVSLAVVVFLAEFSMVWKRRRCEQDSKLVANASEPLAHRFIEYRASAFDAGQTRNVALGDCVDDLKLEAVPAETLLTGDVILIESGQWIPADGTILEGVALVDESVATGQSAPVIREASRVSYVMRDTKIIAGRLIVEVALQRGHPLDWRSATPSQQFCAAAAKVDHQS